MSVRPYLPSGQFAAIYGSIFLAIGLVYGAQVVTHPRNTASLTIDQGTGADHTQWENALASIQASQGAALPVPPDENTVNALRRSVKSQNLTDSVARTLLINVTDAQAQGLGGDIPTQNQLLSAAVSQIQQTNIPSKTYTADDLTVVPDSTSTIRQYGNDVIKVLATHPKASVGSTLQILGAYINNKTNHLNQLTPIGKEYAALAEDFTKVPVPQSEATYDLALINTYAQMADTYPNMSALASDPLRALAGLQMFNANETNAQNLFINIAQVLDKNGIIFSKDEPGAAWAALLSAQ